MRHLISGVVATVAVMAASPALACGYSGCAPTCGYGYGYNPCIQPRYVAPIATFSYGYGYGCGTGCHRAVARLAEPTTQYYYVKPTTQYYYVNQGPTYSGPGAWAPQPTYYDPSVFGWSKYARPYRYVAYPRYVGPRAYGYRGWRS